MHSGSLSAHDESRLASTLEVQSSRQPRTSISCTDAHIEGLVFMPTGANPQNATRNELLSLPIDYIFVARQSQSAKTQGNSMGTSRAQPMPAYRWSVTFLKALAMSMLTNSTALESAEASTNATWHAEPNRWLVRPCNEPCDEIGDRDNAIATRLQHGDRVTAALTTTTCNCKWQLLSATAVCNRYL